MHKTRIISMFLALLMLIPAFGITTFAAEEAEISEAAEVEDTFNITITNNMAYGLGIVNRKTAKSGEAVIISSFGKEFANGKQKGKFEIKGWYCEEFVIDFIKLNNDLWCFYMPDGDVTLHPIFEYTDLTEYYDWNSVVASVNSARNGSTLTVDMESETIVPQAVLEALKGKNISVTFSSGENSFTVSGTDIEKAGGDGFMVRHKETTASAYIKRKVGKFLISAEEVRVSGDSEASALITLPVYKNGSTACVYRISGGTFEFVTLIDISSGTAAFKVDGSGTYIVTSAAIKDTVIRLDADSECNSVNFDGKLLPISAVVDGKLTFKARYSAPIEQLYVAKNYKDISGNAYKSSIDFITARGLIDGVNEFAFAPDSGITVIELLTAISRMRCIEDKHAYQYSYQLDIITHEYPHDYILTRNELSEILTKFVNHLMEYPKSFGGYDMKGFENNAAGWVGEQFTAMNKLSGSKSRYDWSVSATRAEAAYILAAVINTIVAGE